MSVAAGGVEQIDHVNIVVEDLDAMAHFYRDILKLQQDRTTTITGRWIDNTVGLQDVVADVVFFRIGNGTNLELMCYRHPVGTKFLGLGMPNTPGIRHIAFRVQNIGRIVANLEQAGLEFMSQVQEVPADQLALGQGIHKRLIYFRDPEGNLLELSSYVSRLPATNPDNNNRQ
jgi:catechol 2,3-dioxygenase-like lactoylglutathione lyase family enzyme